jgi:phytoene desaturase
MKAAIIGGGLGGLALALRLNASGWSVTVCEKGPTFGGKMNRWSQGGYVFDTGPSLVTMPHVFAELYESLGERAEEHIELVRLDPHAEYVYPNGVRIVFPADVSGWIESIKAIEPRDVDGFLCLHELGERLYELSRRTFFCRSPLSPPRLSDLPALRHLPMRHGWGNYARTVERFIRSSYLQQLYNRYPTYVGSSPYRCPSTLLVIPYIEHKFGAWYVKGGVYRIIESLVGLARRRGVELRHSSPVAAIEHQGRRVTGVRLGDGSTLKADVVVMNGDACTVYHLLGERGGMHPETRSLSGFVMLLGVRGELPDVQHHTVFFSSDYRVEFDDLFVRKRFPADPTVYVNTPGDPSLAPKNSRTVFIMANAPGDGQTVWDSSQVAEARQAVFQRLEKSGFPDIRGRIEVCDVWHPDKFAERYLVPGGAIYGTHSHGWRQAFLRPPNRDRRYSGLFYVGGSSHPGGGTPMVLLSARITTELIQRHARS